MSKRDDKRDDALAEQCQVNPSEFDSKKYAKLIRADEREECAKVCVPILRTARILQNSSEQGAKHDLLFFTC
jgi:hypothetical protein